MVFGAREGADLSRISCWWQVIAVWYGAQMDNWRSSVVTSEVLGWEGVGWVDGSVCVPCLCLWKLAKPLGRNKEEK